MKFSPKLDEALAYTNAIHSGQIRKKTGMPRLAHLLIVAGTVIEHGGTETEAIAALLHDAVEDAGGQERLKDIRARFGDEVAAIVDRCTEVEPDPALSWRERKQAFVRQLTNSSSSVHLIALADKLHNARALLRTYRQQGEGVWGTYTGKKEGTLWYHQSLVTALKDLAPPGLILEVQGVLDDLARVTGSAGGKRG